LLLGTIIAIEKGKILSDIRIFRKNDYVFKKMIIFAP